MIIAENHYFLIIRHDYSQIKEYDNKIIQPYIL